MKGWDGMPTNGKVFIPAVLYAKLETIVLKNTVLKSTKAGSPEQFALNPNKTPRKFIRVVGNGYSVLRYYTKNPKMRLV